MMSSVIVLEGGAAEIEVKKSRFIAAVMPIHSQEEAAERLAAIRKKYYDAKHHCSAYILDGSPGIRHSSDDGEPQGTAGRPILEVMEGAGLADAMICVTRYFGGTLLGTGGLSRAYRDAAKEGLAASRLGTRILACETRVRTDYTDYGRLAQVIAEKGYAIRDTIYEDDVCICLHVPQEETAGFVRLMTDKSGGRALIEVSDPAPYTLE